ncbi:ubiquinol-cytochrome C reductase complex chaperone CBP [Azospirillum sp. B510]|uniref:ubiquinol-cytochrome C chaperone family protein n=1 Tax=Azospirillum sp. (strain B510) TaxID=137722 RepID=UPI0001C4BD8D|nr:ubiquinol-cytochrome C chaperone family protein [Azospirillum sp. B510]BAI71658.1 ubiquinol-cytochrome C reductase complex chaperone CBP [Azospirillum sp. B510]
MSGRFIGDLLGRLGRRDRTAAAVGGLFTAIVAQAREPGFYRALAVPDTLDGRFEMMALHLLLVMRRLKGQGAEAAKLSRRLYETMVDDFEKSLLEMGAGDSGIARRVKTMARGMAGRIRAYDEALADPDEGRLEIALDNNLYGTVDPVPEGVLPAMAAYARACAGTLDAQPLESLLRGEVRFAPVPG